jgi:hypothetical protein
MALCHWVVSIGTQPAHGGLPANLTYQRPEAGGPVAEEQVLEVGVLIWGKGGREAQQQRWATVV